MDRCALVTGAAGDLGRAASIALAADGWSLLIADHPAQAQQLETTRDACLSRGTTVASDTFDVTDAAAVQSAFDMLGARNGVPTAIVASAGVQGDFDPVQRHGEDAFRRVL